MKATVHIGGTKTGSSSLQYFLLTNRAVLRNMGFVYPWHRVDLNGISSGNDDLVRSLRLGRDRRARRLLRRVSEPGLELLLSSELLYSLRPERLLGVLPEMTAVLYLRRHDDWWMSAYQQRVKRQGLTESCEEYVETYRNRPGPYRPAERWLNALGPARLRVRPYEPCRFRDQSLFADFLGLLGLELTSDFQIPRQWINRSLTREALEYKRLLNRLNPKANPFDRPIQAYSDAKDRGSAWPHALLSPASRLAILGRHADEVDRITRELPELSGGRLFQAPPPEPGEPWEPFPGLSEADVREITEFVVRHSPHVRSILRRCILGGLRSDDPARRAAAHRLESALEVKAPRGLRSTLRLISGRGTWIARRCRRALRRAAPPRSGGSGRA